MSALNKILLGHPHTVVFHHSKSPRNTTFENVREWHTAPQPAGNGWREIGYHYLIGGDAGVYKGEALHFIGRHAIPNAGKIGVCITGDNCNPDHEWAPDQIVAGVKLWWHLRAIFPGIALAGHRDVTEPGYTECPGLDVCKLFALVEEIRGATWEGI